MHLERKAEWVKRLRSGDYRQGQNALKAINDEGTGLRYCCLGVACDMAEEAGVVYSKMNEFGIFTYRSVLGFGDSSDMHLPSEVSDWLGLDSSNPSVYLNDDTDEKESLASLNDVGGWSFDMIADAIEKNL